jgi:hypothetical protein
VVSKDDSLIAVVGSRYFDSFLSRCLCDSGILLIFSIRVSYTLDSKGTKTLNC